MLNTSRFEMGFGIHDSDQNTLGIERLAVCFGYM